MIASMLTFVGTATVLLIGMFAAYQRWIVGRREASYLNNVLNRQRGYEQVALRRRMLSHTDTHRHAVVRPVRASSRERLPRELS